MATPSRTQSPIVPASVPQPAPANPAAAGANAAPQPGMRLPAMFRALRHRNYRLFFFGQLISLSGTWMQMVAQGWLVLRLSDSPALLGIVAAATSLPVLFLSLPAGAIIDRMSKHKLLLITQVTAMLLAVILALLTLSGLVQVWHILVLALLLGCVNAFDATTRQAFTVEMAGREDLMNAIALNSSIFNGARTVGPAIAGVVVALIGEGPAFLLNAISFLAVILSLLLMRLPPYSPPARTRPRGQIREGFAYIAREPTVRTLLTLAGVISFFGFAYIPLLPIFARDVLQAGAQGLGLLSAASGLGALGGALLLAQFGDRLPRGKMVLTALLLHPLAMMGFSASQWLPLSMLMLVFTGLFGVSSMAGANTLIQTAVRDDVRGRVMSVFTLILMGLSPLGGMLAGSIAQFAGSTPLIVGLFAAIGWLIIITIVLREPHLRRL